MLVNYKDRFNVAFRAIAIILACPFLFNDIAYACLLYTSDAADE